jgi:hypothetical protein
VKPFDKAHDPLSSLTWQNPGAKANILAVLAVGPLTTAELRKKLKPKSKQSLSTHLNRLKAAGAIRQDAMGKPWSLNKSHTKTVARAAHVATNGHAAPGADLSHPPAIGSKKDPLIDDLLERRAKALDEVIRALVG